MIYIFEHFYSTAEIIIIFSDYLCIVLMGLSKQVIYWYIYIYIIVIQTIGVVWSDMRSIHKCHKNIINENLLQQLEPI